MATQLLLLLWVFIGGVYLCASLTYHVTLHRAAAQLLCRSFLWFFSVARLAGIL